MADHPLYSAVLGDDPEEVRVALAAWPEGKPLDPKLLELAFVDPRTAIVCELIQAGMNPNGEDPEDPGWPLRWAANSGSLEIIECLLQAGGDPDLLGADHDGALNLARGKDHTEIAERLLQAGATEPVQASAELRTAVLWNKTAEVRQLLPSTLTKQEADALLNLSLRSHCNPGLLELLLDQGADPNAHISEAYGDFETAPPLYVAVHHRRTACLPVLLERGAHPSALGGELMREAGEAGSVPMIDMLLQAGLDVDAGDWEGTTALMGAAWLGHLNLVEHLLSRGADANKKCLNNHPEYLNGATALIFAVKGEHEAIVRLLLAKGADPNLADAAGLPPPHVGVGLGTSLSLIGDRRDPPGSGSGRERDRSMAQHRPRLCSGSQRAPRSPSVVRREAWLAAPTLVRNPSSLHYPKGKSGGSAYGRPREWLALR